MRFKCLKKVLAVCLSFALAAGISCGSVMAAEEESISLETVNEESLLAESGGSFDEADVAIECTEHEYVIEGTRVVCGKCGTPRPSGTPVIDGDKYWVGNNGELCSGWLYLGNWKMYFYPDTYKAAVGFCQVGEKTFLFNDDGVMQNYAGTTVINGKKYWFSDDEASLKTGWLDLGQWKLYFSPDDFAALTNGVYCVDGTHYLFDANGSLYRKSGTPLVNGRKYWTTDKGTVKAGWLYLGNWKMYFDPTDYAAAVGMHEINEKMYMFNDDGVMQTYAGTTVINGKKYWFSDDDASLKTGWLDLGQWVLYFDPETYWAVTDETREIDGYVCTFDSNGVLKSKRLVNDYKAAIKELLAGYSVEGCSPRYATGFLDKDDIPELFIQDKNTSKMHFYYFINGQYTYIADLGSVGSFGSAVEFKYKERDNRFLDESIKSFGLTVILKSYNAKKGVLEDEKVMESQPTKSYYSIDGKVVTKDKFNEEVNETRNKMDTVVKWSEMTAI